MEGKFPSALFFFVRHKSPMRIVCFFLVFGIFSTGCSGCDDKEQSGSVENQKPATNRKAIRISPAARKLFDEAGTADAAP